MPQKNTIKNYLPDTYYHVYFRGANKQSIFLESGDFGYFTNLFDRYLSGKKRVSKTGVNYPSYAEDIKLISYCLMKNHVHLLLFQGKNNLAIRKLMSSLMTSYSKYFNLKYRRVGSVFESRYKAKDINNDSYLIHITRYIHMNPRRWINYRHSSLQFMMNDAGPDWLHTKYALSNFSDKQEYIEFLKSYQDSKEALEDIKHLLADR